MLLKRKKRRKIKFLDSESSVHARANRVRSVREMAKLSRRIIAEKYHINFNTFKGWEVERHGGLTLKGAKQLVSILKDNGIWCTAEWLVYGIGFGPQRIDKIDTQEKSVLSQYDSLFFMDERRKRNHAGTAIFQMPRERVPIHAYRG